MSPFDVLLIAHLVGDYLLQTHWMALNKSNNWLALIIHSGMYTTVIGFSSFWFSHSLSCQALMVIFLTHVILDHRYFVRWWLNHIMRVSQIERGGMGRVVDQTFHIIILAVSLYI